MKLRILLVLFAILLLRPAAADPRTAWFEDARFGMFIHFGLYSVPAGIWDGKRMTRNDYAEWIRFQHDWPKPGGIPKADYDTLLGEFNPTGFDADTWAGEAKNAGMRYLLITESTMTALLCGIRKSRTTTSSRRLLSNATFSLS